MVEKYIYLPPSPRVGHVHPTLLMLQRTLAQRVECLNNSQLRYENPYHTGRVGASDALTLDASSAETLLTCSLGKGIDTPGSVRCCVRCHTLDTWHAGSSPAYTERTNSPIVVFDASVRCLKSINTSSKRELSKTKFDPLDLRTLSKLPSARINKCAPHLDLKSCLG